MTMAAPGPFSTITFTATTTGNYFLDVGPFDNDYFGQYGLSAIEGSKAHFDEMMAAGALTRDLLSWSSPGTAATVTWGVRASFANSTDAQNQPAPFSQLTAQQIAAVQSALGSYSEVANITFSRVNPGGTTDNATMLFSNYTSKTDGVDAYALSPGSTAPTAADGDVRLNTEGVSTTSLPRGSASFLTLAREIGHAIGLSNPGDYNAGPGVPVTYDGSAQFIEDSRQFTIMSPFDESNTTDSYNSFPDTLMLFDVLALQQLYGVNKTTRTGDTVYGFGSNAGSLYDFAINDDPALCIWDAGGADTLDASGFAQNQVINLAAGRFSDIGGFKGNVSIAFGAVIENATGGKRADLILGNSSANVLKDGGGAADALRGLSGNDTYLVYAAGTKIVEGSNGGADRVLAAVDFALGAGQHVEALATTNGSGTSVIDLTGNALHQRITGNAGVNVLSDGGVGKADTMSGLSGNDTYRVYNAGDVIEETSAQGAADRVMAAVDYALGTGVHVESLTTNGSTGTSDIKLTGNEIAQEIVGNAGDNRLEGKGGSDTLRGLGGDDTFVFATALGASNVDKILDFNVADDRFLLSDAIFAALNTGVLLSGYFRANTTGLAQDVNDHIIYETDTGELYYDANGSAAGGGVLFARIAVGLSLSNADFTVA